MLTHLHKFVNSNGSHEAYFGRIIPAISKPWKFNLRIAISWNCKRWNSQKKDTSKPQPVHHAPKPIDLSKDKIITDRFSKLRDKYLAPKNPIVLCHGFSGFDQLTLLPQHLRTENLIGGGMMHLDYWYGIKEALEEIGAKVLIARVPAFGTIAQRAESLNNFISSQCSNLQPDTFAEYTGGLQVNLVAHSMGGLDCRYLISRLPNKNFEVASLTTVSTPHHGSECADFIVHLIDKSPLLLKVCPPAVFELTTDYLKEFNRKVPDNPDVSYFSYGARFRPKWFNAFYITWAIIKQQIQKNNKDKSAVHVDNDGMVTVDSAMWGRYLGTLDEVDHLDLINWTNRIRTAVDKSLLHKEPKFNAVALYLDIADNLQKRGL